MPAEPVRLVLVPGLGLDERSSARVRERLPATVVHLPGMGLPGPVPRLETLAERLLKELGEGPVVLAGHSQSCQVVALAACDPRVVAVVLFGPTTDPRLRSAAGLVGRWLATAWAEPWWQVPLVLAQWAHTGPRAMAALWRVAAPDRIDRRLRDVRAGGRRPGNPRPALPARLGSPARRAAPRGRLVELPGAAHMTVRTHPDDVVAILREVVS